MHLSSFELFLDVEFSLNSIFDVELLRAAVAIALTSIKKRKKRRNAVASKFQLEVLALYASFIVGKKTRRERARV